MDGTSGVCCTRTLTFTHLWTHSGGFVRLDPGPQQAARWAVWMRTPPGGRGAKVLVHRCKETLNKCLPSNITALTKSKVQQVYYARESRTPTPPPLTSHVNIKALKMQSANFFPQKQFLPPTIIRNNTIMITL